MEGDAGQLEQLFHNLLLNAAEALEGGGRAWIHIRTAGDTVEVLVQDEGRGISVESLEKVFEPFFSTSSEGTGLGLPIARQIARAHGGELLLESSEGSGTTARVTLPAKGEAS